MTHCLFIHDFFQDGRLDALSEVRMLRDLGQWTRELRASWIKKAVATHARLKRTQHPGVTYFAGRLAALKSGLTADCCLPWKPSEPKAGLMIFRPLPPDTDRFCGLFDCGSDAIWGLSLSGERHLFVLLCDACRQEWERSETVYVTASGWDWDADEEDQLLPLPNPLGNKLVVKEQFLPTSIFFPSVAFIGVGMFEVSLHVSLGVFMLEILLLVHFMVYRKKILAGFRKLSKSSRSA